MVITERLEQSLAASTDAKNISDMVTETINLYVKQIAGYVAERGVDWLEEIEDKCDPYAMTHLESYTAAVLSAHVLGNTHLHKAGAQELKLPSAYKMLKEALPPELAEKL